MRTALILASLVFGFSFAAQAQTQTCPLGAGQTELTIQRVMINFGKYTMSADGIVSAGAASDAELASAANDLQVAAACAQAVIDGTTDALLPSGARDRSGAARDAYVADFKQAMSNLKAALVDYSTALANHDLATAKEKKQLVNQIADDAHSRF